MLLICQFCGSDARIFPLGDWLLEIPDQDDILGSRLKPTIDNEIPLSPGLRGIFILYTAITLLTCKSVELLDLPGYRIREPCHISPYIGFFELHEG